LALQEEKLPSPQGELHPGEERKVAAQPVEAKGLGKALNT